MISKHPMTLPRLTPVVVLWLVSAGAMAAVPVEESVGSTRGGAAAPVRVPDATGGAQNREPQPVDARAMSSESSRLTELFYQLQILQQEVQELRGMVEEQSHQLGRLARDQQEQYLDLDRRMQALRSNGQAAAPLAGGAPAEHRGAAAAGGSGSLGEREAYAAAFELMRQRQFDESIAGFRRLVQQYPNGEFTGNAFYWLGELHLAKDETEQARQAFVQVINLFPDHQKVPDAMYKLGVVYHRLGDVDRARDYLNQVRSRHPQSSAAGLAQTYLAEL
jgi:tol-pal system protein YbgF